MTLRERFDDKWTPEPFSGCWLWTASCDSYGYGRIFDKKSRKTNRVAWELYKGAIPSGMCVLHTCDVPSCVNPDHLFLGTMRDNTQDIIRKERIHDRRGELNGNSKLTADDVLEIRASSDTITALAKRFNVSTLPNFAYQKQ